MENQLLLQILWVIPPYTVVIMLEHAWIHFVQHKPYSKPKTNIAFMTGAGYVISKYLHSLLLAPVFVLAAQLTPLHISMDQPWAYVFLLFFSEFCYYWYHRLTHEVRFAWTAHAVHHSSDVMNFAAAYRLPWNGWVINALTFTLPLILVGFSPFVALTTWNINLFIQFWTHNRIVPRNDWVERIFNTPSLHRVHHSRNPRYLDKNYGAVLVIYDHLFGTFQSELEDVPCDYGLVGDAGRPTNPFRVALGDTLQLARDVLYARDWRERWNYLIKPPGWRPEGESYTTADLVARERSSQLASPSTAKVGLEGAAARATRAEPNLG